MLAAFAFLFPLLSLASAFTPPNDKEIEAAEKTFKFRGHWIHPKIVREFLPWESDYELPLVLSVDVGAATGTNRYYGDTEEKKGSVLFKETDGTITSYEWKGRLKNGLHVVVVKEAGSGSLVGNSLAVFRLFPQAAKDGQGKPYTQLRLSVERIVTLGDRADTKISLSGNTVEADVNCGKGCDSKKLKLQFD